MNKLNDFQAVDLFCGVGGLSYGLKQGGIDVVLGIDIDKTCAFAFEANIGAAFINKSISEVTANDVKSFYNNGKKLILVGCAPCQPFSSHSYKIKDKVDISTEDERWKLLYEFRRLVEELQPDIISMENVPQIIKHQVFKDFIFFLKEQGYHLSKYDKPVYCPDYGIPQKRQRLVLLASKLGEIELISPTHTKYITVEETIGKLNPIKDGEMDANDFLHRSRKLSPMNLKRIEKLKEGESWTSFKGEDEKLIAPCHQKSSGKKFTSVYARMSWKDVAPTITTHCIGLSNGRFGHPEQNRAISLREAALLQSFPITYQFIGNEKNYNIANVARHIGNAVPPKLGEAIAKSIKQHLEQL